MRRFLALTLTAITLANGLAPGLAHAQGAYYEGYDDGGGYRAYREYREYREYRDDEYWERQRRRERRDEEVAAGVGLGILGLGIIGAIASSSANNSRCGYADRPVVNRRGEVIRYRRVRTC